MDNQFQKTISDLIPPKDKMIAVSRIPEECSKRDVDISLRNLRLYATKGLIPKPIHKGKEAFYHKDFILDQLSALFVLKTMLNRSVKQLRNIAANRHVPLQRTVSIAQRLLEELFQDYIYKDKYGPSIFQFVNENWPRFVVDKFLKKMEKSDWDPSNMNAKEFIINAIPEFSDKNKGKK